MKNKLSRRPGFCGFAVTQTDVASLSGHTQVNTLTPPTSREEPRLHQGDLQLAVSWHVPRFHDNKSD